MATAFHKNTAQREPLKRWECGEPHYFKYFLVRRKCLNDFHSIQEATIVGDIARIMLRISAALENRQVDHQTSMVKIEGMIK